MKTINKRGVYNIMKELTIEIIQSCNKKCIYCSSNSSIGCNKCINLNKFKEVIDDGIKLGFDVVKLSGGEPLLHKDIFKMIKYCNSKNIKVILFTSGIIKNNKSISKTLIKKLCKCGVKEILFNLPSIDSDIFKIISGVNIDINIVLKSIKNANNHILTGINFVPMHINYDELYSIVQFAINNNVNYVHILGLINQGRAKKYNNIISMSNIDKDVFNKLIVNINNKYNNILKVGKSICYERSCNAYSDKAVITFNGDVYPCEALQNINKFNNIRPDNIYDNSLKYIYKNSKFLIDICKQGKKYGCEKCICKF